MQGIFLYFFFISNFLYSLFLTIAQLILFFIFCQCISYDFQRDKQHGFDVLKGAAGDKNSDILSSDKQWFVKHIVPEETFENEHIIKASVSDPRLQKSHWENTSLPLKQPGVQSGNHLNFPRGLVNFQTCSLAWFSY